MAPCSLLSPAPNCNFIANSAPGCTCTMSDAKDPLAEALATLANAINWPSTTELRAAVELATQLLKSASHLQQHYQDVINAAAAVWVSADPEAVACPFNHCQTHASLPAPSLQNASLGVASNEHSHGAELAAALKQACVDLQWAGHTPASLLPAQKPQLAEQSFKVSTQARCIASPPLSPTPERPPNAGRQGVG